MTTTTSSAPTFESIDRVVSYGLLETIGLNPKLHKVVQWARKIGVDESLLCLLDASKTDKHPAYLGTLIHYLQDAKTNALLKSWSDESTSCKELFDLSLALITSEVVSTDYPPIPFLKPVSSQLAGGLLTELPLVALTARPVPSDAGLDTDWIEALRAWIFVQNFEQISDQRHPNSYLEDVTNKLRLGIDKDSKWLVLFSQLICPTTSFFNLKRTLLDRCEQRLKGKVNSTKNESHRTLLSHFKNYCQGKEAPSAGNREVGLYTTYLRGKGSSRRSKSISNFLWDRPLPDSAPDADEQLPAVFEIEFACQPMDEDVLFAVDSSAEETPLEQTRHATGILLHTVDFAYKLSQQLFAFRADIEPCICAWKPRRTVV